MAVHNSVAWHWRQTNFGFTLQGLSSLREQLSEFHALLVFPSLPTWSRLPALNRQGPRPLRSADFPWGRPEISKRSASRLDAENALLKMTFGIVNDFLSQSNSGSSAPKSRALAWLLPEDLGPLHNFHPASPWQLPELHELARQHNLYRAAFHQCRHERGLHSRPTGVLSSFELPSGTSKQGWPRFTDQPSGLKGYSAPLNKACGCGQQHKSMLRRHGVFRSTSRRLEHASARLMGASFQLGFQTSDTAQDGLQKDGEQTEAQTLRAILPDFIAYPVDDDGYDTDGTIFQDPPNRGQLESGQSDRSERTNSSTNRVRQEPPAPQRNPSATNMRSHGTPRSKVIPKAMLGRVISMKSRQAFQQAHGIGISCNSSYNGSFGKQTRQTRFHARNASAVGKGSFLHGRKHTLGRVCEPSCENDQPSLSVTGSSLLGRSGLW